MKNKNPKEYYEAKIQVRPKNKELFDFVSEQIKNTKSKIVLISELKEGYDIFIDSSKVAVKLGKQFRGRYKIKPKITKSLVGEDKQKGKRIHKVTVLLRVNS